MKKIIALLLAATFTFAMAGSPAAVPHFYAVSADRPVLRHSPALRQDTERDRPAGRG